MAAVFPQASLNPTVELGLGAWTDISTYVYQRDPINITRGRPDESSQANPSQCTLTLNNRDNRFTINNPTGPYYGALNRNTPLRASVPNSLLPAPANTTYLRMEDDAVSYASCPAVSRIELTGSLDIRVDAHPSGYGQFVFASIWGAATGVNQRSWEFGLANNGQLFFGYSTNGTNSFFADSDVRLPVAVGRQCFRVTLDATTGNVAFYTAAPGNVDSGPWTQIGATKAGTGAVTVFASASTPLTVGYSAGNAFDFGNIALQGAVFDMELRSGIGGTIVAWPAFNAQTAGASTWTDSPGNTWTVTGSAVLSNRSYRYHGELTATPKAADPSASDVYSQATASGILRRLQQASTPLNSPMYRAYVRQTGTAAPIAYWPCEDGTASTQIASGLPSGQPMHVSGSPTYASNTDIASSDALPVLNGSIWRAPAAQGGTWTYNALQMVIAFPASPTSETNEEVVASIYTTGTVARIDLQYQTTGNGAVNVAGYNSAGTNLFTYGPLGPLAQAINGSYLNIGFGMQQVGSSVNAVAQIYGPNTSGTALYGETIAGVTLGVVTQVAINPSGTCQQLAVGHVAVIQNASTIATLSSPFNGWAGETAAARVQRLCTEENIQARITGHPELSLQMGPQTIQTLSDLLQECETTDRGMLYEPRTCLGIGYRTPFSMYNQPAKAAVSYSAQALGAEFASTCDDLLTINDVTASNTDGSSARQVLTSGPLSVNPPPNGVGRVDTEIQVNTLSDAYLSSVAQWILHTSTDGHDRYPLIPFNLARTQTGFAVATLDIGDLAAVTNPPPWLQPDEIDQLCAGFAETLGPYAVWQIDANGIPAYPYTVAECAPAVSGAASFTASGPYATHADTDGTTLTSAVSATAPGLSFTSLANYPAWTSNPGDYPFDVNIAGERVTIVGPGGTLGTDPFLANGAANYVGNDAAITMSGAVGAPYPATGYGQQAILVTPVGSPDTFANMEGANSAPGTVTASTSYTLWAWVYATAARSYQLLASWKLNGTSVSTSMPAAVALTAGTWTLITGTVTSPASGVNELALGVADNASPSAANTFYVWGLNGAPTSTITAASPQRVTAQRSVNGVSKTQAAGTSLALWYTPICGQLTGA